MTFVGDLGVGREFPGAQVDDRFEGFGGVEEDIQGVCGAGDYGQWGSTVFGVQVGQYKGLGGFIEGDCLEMDWCIDGIRPMENRGCSSDFGWGERVERVDSHPSLQSVCSAIDVAVCVSRSIYVLAVDLRLRLEIDFFGDSGDKSGDGVIERFSCSHLVNQ